MLTDNLQDEVITDLEVDEDTGQLIYGYVEDLPQQVNVGRNNKNKAASTRYYSFRILWDTFLEKKIHFFKEKHIEGEVFFQKMSHKTRKSVIVCK